MRIEKQIKLANNAIKNAKAVREASKKILAKKTEKQVHPEHIKELSKIMQNVADSTDKAMKGAKLAESRAKSRLMAVKKATAKTISYTAKAKNAALASKKTANAALMTSKKMKTKALQKKYQKTYNIQIHASLNAAHVAKVATEKALEAAKTARIAARMPLEEMKI